MSDIVFENGSRIAADSRDEKKLGEPGCVVCGKPRHAIDILGEAWCFSCYWQEMADSPGSEVIG